jgi:DNA-binding NarL/FixJ family response regulator
MSALLLCADSSFLSAGREVLNRLGVTARIAADWNSAVPAIGEDEFDAVIVDWREMSDFSEFLIALRRSKLNQECVLVAIGCDRLDLQQAFAAGAQFFIHKPASPAQIERCLRAVYCASVALRVKRHREAVSIVASMSTRSQPFGEVTIANLSERGARLKVAADSRGTGTELKVGAGVDLCFALPDNGEMLRCMGRVVWSSPQNHAGVRFSYIPGQERLAEWLTTCVERSRAERCGRLRAECA